MVTFYSVTVAKAAELLKACFRHFVKIVEKFEAPLQVLSLGVGEFLAKRIKIPAVPAEQHSMILPDLLSHDASFSE